jgi:PAS domain S-box-containing protein
MASLVKSNNDIQNIMNSIEKNLMVNLVASENMLEVVHHLSLYGSSMGFTSLICGRYTSFNNRWNEITPWTHPLMKAASPNDITPSSTNLVPWSDISTLSLDTIANKIKSQVKDRSDDARESSKNSASSGNNSTRIVIQKYNEQREEKYGNNELEASVSNSVMIAIRLDNKKGEPFGLLAFIAPISSLIFLKSSLTTSTPTTMEMIEIPSSFEETFIQLSEISLLRTSQHGILRENSSILTRMGTFNNLKTGVIAVDLDSLLVHYNKTLENMVGWTSSDVQTKGWTNLVYPDPQVRSQMGKGIATLLLNSTGHTVHRTLTRKNGTTVVCEVTSFSIHRQDGGPPVLVGYFTINDSNNNTSKKRTSSHDMIATDEGGIKKVIPSENKKQLGSNSNDDSTNESDPQVQSRTVEDKIGANAKNKDRNLNISRLGSLAGAIGKKHYLLFSKDFHKDFYRECDKIVDV